MRIKKVKCFRVCWGAAASEALCLTVDILKLKGEFSDKFLLFPAVAADGALPRKTFSMGEANEKRYYIETRFIAK